MTVHTLLGDRLLAALGREDEAQQWYGSFEGFSHLDGVYAAEAHLQLARMADRAGRRSDARRHYERVVFLWADADPELQSTVHEADEALRRLG